MINQTSDGYHQISSYNYEESFTVINLLEEYIKVDYLKEEHPKGFHFYVKANSLEEAKVIGKQITLSIRKPKYEDAIEYMQKNLDNYFGESNVRIELSDMLGNEHRLTIVSDNVVILEGDFEYYPNIDLYPEGDVVDIFSCHYADKDTFLPFIDSYFKKQETYNESYT